nr:hypothetical protein CFP56_72022 [Quercus suber]
MWVGNAKDYWKATKRSIINLWLSDDHGLIEQSSYQDEGVLGTEPLATARRHLRSTFSKSFTSLRLLWSICSVQSLLLPRSANSIWRAKVSLYLTILIPLHIPCHGGWRRRPLESLPRLKPPSRMQPRRYYREPQQSIINRTSGPTADSKLLELVRPGVQAGIHCSTFGGRSYH